MAGLRLSERRAEKRRADHQPRRARLWTEFVHAHVQRTDSNRIHWNKLEMRRIIDQADLPAATLLQHVTDADDLRIEELPQRCVIKPHNQASKRGVMLLERRGDSFHERLSGDALRSEEVLERVRSAIAGGSRILVEDWFVGESGSGAIPQDYKLFTFDRGVAFAVHIDRNTTPNTITLFDGALNALDESEGYVNERAFQVGRGHAPPNPDELVSLARRAQRAVDRPFLSVDLYTNGETAVIGELTSSPGGPYVGWMYRFKPDFDRSLGKLMVRGYRRRGWPIPEVTGSVPSHRFW